MRGLVLAGPETVEFRPDLPDPRIEAPSDVLVSVGRAGICGSDLHPYFGREPIAWGVVPGHEAAGEISAAGGAVREFVPGDRVFLPFSTSCGVCLPCASGLSARCERGRLFGWGDPAKGRDGALQGTQAETVRVPLADATLIHLPESLTLEDGVLLGDNFTTGYYCARRAGPGAGRLTVVIGCGTVGLSALAAARSLGAGPILAVDPIAERRERALRMGAERTAAPKEALAALAELGAPHDRGAPVVLEAVGSAAARRLAVEVAAHGGTISSVGVPTDDFGIAPAELYDRNLTYRAGRCPVRSLVPEVLDAVSAGRLVLPTKELVAAEPIPLEDGPAAYRRFASREDLGGKPVLAP